LKPEARDYIHYLEDIMLSMERIQEYVVGMDFIGFKRDFKTVDAVIRNFEIIGKAAKNLPLRIKESNPNVPWQEMYRLRNRASHEYFGLDYEIIWHIIQDYLPKNHEDITRILTEERAKRI
jgi:uncharacterized protein with HEPN domain